ncbi:MAG: ankyrin repeat domain-containing protein [Spirochaetes bacterium]|nr:ankyrin repeat domain-containing protein [Spirochaetota bacterium]
MKKSAFFNTVVIFALAVFLPLLAGCSSTPEPIPVQADNVWVMLESGDTRAMDLFLGEVDVNARDPAGKTPLHHAAMLEDPILAAFFISLGAEIDVLDNDNQSPLGISAERDDPSVARVLVTAGADIHFPSRNNLSPAQIALASSNAFFNSLLTPATIESTDAQGRTILHLASDAGNIQAVSSVLSVAHSYGLFLPVYTRTNVGQNALDLALSRGDSRDHMEIAEQLILANAVSEHPIFAYFAPAARTANYNIRRSDGLAAIHHAARDGHTGLISFILERRADINIQTNSGSTALHEAARAGDLNVMTLLLMNGAAVNAQDAQGNSPLHIGIPASVHRDAAALFLAHGANPNLRDASGDSPLHIAVTLNRDADLLQTLLDSGADVSIRNIEGRTPLFTAVQRNRVGLISTLLVYGSDIFAADYAGTTPLDLALRNGGDILFTLISLDSVFQSDSYGNTMLHAAIENNAATEHIGMILDRRPTVNARNHAGDTALHLAVRRNQAANGEFLIIRGADIFAANTSGESPLFLSLTAPDSVRQWLFNPTATAARDGLGNNMLHYAAQWDLHHHIPFIAQRGASLANSANATGETPLFTAVTQNSPPAVRALLTANANINARDSMGNSTLHVAVRWNSLDAAATLLDGGIDVNAASLAGTSSLHYAVILENTNMEILLIQRGANLEVRDNEGNTPFMYAVMAANVDSVRRLASAGASPMVRNVRGDTPLHLAVAIENYEVAAMLLQMDTSIHARNTRERTPFQTALSVSPRMVSSLLAHNRMNTLDDFGNSALHVAIAERASPVIVREILATGIRTNAVDSHGRTPLRRAVDLEAWETARLLADSGADPFSLAVDNRTPAEVAILRGEEAIIAVFSGMAVSATDSSGNNVLHYAARWGTPQSISLLLELGANRNLRNIAAESPVDIAVRWNHPANAALLQPSNF